MIPAFMRAAGAVLFLFSIKLGLDTTVTFFNWVLDGSLAGLGWCISGWRHSKVTAVYDTIEYLCFRHK